MKKRILSLIVVLSVIANLIIALPITASAATSGTCGDNLTWTLDDEGTLTISGTGAMADYTSNSSPWYPFNSDITSVLIEDGVTSIGKRAFSYCPSLTEVTIGNGVTSIGESAFEDCDRPNRCILYRNGRRMGTDND